MLHLLYRLLGLATTARILAAGDPERIAKHVARRVLHKQSAKLIRRLLK